MAIRDGKYVREVTEPVPDKFDGETHPAWGVISAARVSVGGTGGGSVLFDSELRHGHTVVVRIHTASRRRNLNRDWIHAEREIIEVEMAEAQWAQFVSSMNAGDTPVTIRRREDDVMVDAMPYSPRLRESMDEVSRAAKETYARVEAAFAAYKEKKTAKNLRDLEMAIQHVESNVKYVAQSLTEHTENVVSKARADIEAFVTAAADRHGIEAGDAARFQLTDGSGES
jgi:hypothetical protein